MGRAIWRSRVALLTGVGGNSRFAIHRALLRFSGMREILTRWLEVALELTCALKETLHLAISIAAMAYCTWRVWPSHDRVYCYC